MSGRTLLVSLRCNPAHIQLLIAYAKAVQALGVGAAFLLDPAYSRFPELRNAAPVLESGCDYLGSHWDCAIFMNPSLKNLETARELKTRGTWILYIFHEPWQMSLKYVKDEGFSAAWKAILAHRTTVPVLRNSDHIILASGYGLRTYRASDARYNSQASYIPLLYDDDLREDLPGLIQKKRYFSFIGNPCRAHGFDQFLDVVRLSFQRNLDVRFLIATGHSLPRGSLTDSVFSRNSHRIEIRCGRQFSNEEINDFYAQSISVWNVYRRSTQSGVLPKALMFGAPVLCSDVGSFPEYVKSGQNGEIVLGSDPECIIEAFERFQEDLATYATRCRLNFISTFYYRAHLSAIRNLMPPSMLCKSAVCNPVR